MPSWARRNTRICHSSNSSKPCSRNAAWSHPPLFQVMVNHQRRDYRGLSTLPGLQLQRYELSERAAQFELMLSTVEHPDGRVTGSVMYAAGCSSRCACNDSPRTSWWYCKPLQSGRSSA